MVAATCLEVISDRTVAIKVGNEHISSKSMDRLGTQAYPLCKIVSLASTARQSGFVTSRALQELPTCGDRPKVLRVVEGGSNHPCPPSGLRGWGSTPADQVLSTKSLKFSQGRLLSGRGALA